MQQFEVLRIKNELVLLFFISSMLIYGAFVTIGLFERVLFFPFTIATFFIPLAFVKYKKMSPPTIKWMIIICGNISLVFLNTMTFSFINIIWFIYFLLLISIYESRKTNVLFGIITLFEILFLIFFHFSAVKEVIRMPYLNSLIFLISILLIICGIQALYLKRFWKQVKNIKLHNEQQLHSQEAYLQLFFEHANDCIAVFSLDNRIIDVNPAFEEVYGWTRSECVGKIIQLVPQNNDEAATNRYQQLLGGQSFKLLETQDMRKDGTVFDVEISLSPIYDHNKKMVAISVISRDISYKKENEKLIIQSEKLKLAGEIVAGVAHEIRNPMTVVSGFV
ncbi:MAG: PAS domain S-box protein, partial [Lysinibacillus sp.]